MSGKRRVDNWMSQVTDEQKEMVDTMLKRFGLDAIYSVDSPLPNAEFASFPCTKELIGK
jgi:hypothetical protein